MAGDVAERGDGRLSFHHMLTYVSHKTIQNLLWVAAQGCALLRESTRDEYSYGTIRIYTPLRCAIVPLRVRCALLCWVLLSCVDTMYSNVQHIFMFGGMFRVLMDG